MVRPIIRSPEQLEEAVLAFGFLPFFECGVPGLSVEEMTPPELWFTELDGPWDWKGRIARNRRCVYGKFFGGRAGFVSLRIFPDFANYRRDGYDFDARWEDGLARRKDKAVFDAVLEHGPINTRGLKAACGFERGTGGFEGVVTRLQMQNYLVVSDFVRAKNRSGREYGWAVSVYAAPEQLFGQNFLDAAYRRTPEESFETAAAFLAAAMPAADPNRIRGLLR